MLDDDSVVSRGADSEVCAFVFEQDRITTVATVIRKRETFFFINLPFVLLTGQCEVFLAV